MVWFTRIENSPEFDARMQEYRKEREQEEARGNRQLESAYDAWRASGNGWLPMEQCPFEGLRNRYGLDGAILVTDGTERALVSVTKRFGTPIFYKTEPEYVMRDGMLHLVGGERDPRDDLPDWWWEWELTDEFGLMTYADGEETGKEEVGFVPTLWSFLPEIPASD